MAQGDSTKSVHGPDAPQPGPLTTPIVQTSTFIAQDTQAWDDIYDGRAGGYVYTRYANPTLDSAARRLAQLEGARRALLFASGMAAISTTALALTRAGGRVLAVEDVYGGTSGLLDVLLPRMGVRVERFPTTSAKALEDLLSQGPADLVYLESPTNPTLRLAPLREMAAIARRHGVPTAIDSTFASPVNSRPIEHGIDLVIHSTTKYLGGHADIIGGAVAGPEALIARVHATQKVLGPSMDPHAAFLLERGMKTLALRVRQSNANALALAQRLERHPKVARVHYPGLASHPQHGLAREQMPGGFGGVVSFDLPGGKAQAARFADNLQVFRNAPSLGGVESLVSLPVVHSHRALTPEALARSGIVPGTVRLAVGVEDASDLLADVEQALWKC